MNDLQQYTRILVTGAGGRLGRLLQGAYRAVCPQQVEVLFAARSGPSDLPPFSAEDVPPDLPPVDMVVGLWGVTSGNRAALDRNRDLVAGTFAAACATGARRTLHLSSAAVYGPGADLTESDPMNAATEYGRSKLLMEQAVMQLQSDHCQHCSIRLANVVGADSLAPALRSGPALPVTLTRFADGGGPQRSYISPGHLLEVFCALARLPVATALPRALNVAAATPVEMEALARSAGKEVLWSPATIRDRQTVTLSTARLRGLLPDLPLNKTAQNMIADWQHAEAHV